MAYSHTLDLVQGDTNPQLTLTLRDANKAVAGKTLDPENSDTWEKIDLTGGQVRLKVRPAGSTDLKETLTGTLVDPTNGVVTFLFNPTTLDTAGVLECECEYTDSFARVQTVYELIRIRVREQF